MKIVSALLPPIASQSQPRDDQASFDHSGSEHVREVFAELVDDNLSVPVSVFVERDLISQQQSFSQLPLQAQSLSERVDLRLLRQQPFPVRDLPLNNQRALASYQAIGADPVVSAHNIARLDIIV